MDKPVTLTFLGDLMCQMQQISAMRKSGGDWNRIFRDVAHLWADSDYVVGNLETPVTGKGGFRLAFEEMRFNAPTEFLAAIKHAGINCLTVANNHILDRGPSGLDATLDQIRVHEMDAVGAYKYEEDSHAPFVKTIGGIRFAFVACTYDTNSGRKADMLEESQLWKVDYIHHPTAFLGTFAFAVKRTVKELIPYRIKQFIKRFRTGKGYSNSRPQLDSFPLSDFYLKENQVFLDRICDKIQAARKIADIVIALPHIGGQYNAVPGPWQKAVEEALIKAGADMVVANHAHTPLEIDWGGSKPTVVNALGNFCFTPFAGFYNDACQADYSIVVQCKFTAAARQPVCTGVNLVRVVVEKDGVAVVRCASWDDPAAQQIAKRVFRNRRVKRIDDITVELL